MAAEEDARTSWGRGAGGGEGKLQVTLRNRRSPAVVLKRCVQIRYERSAAVCKLGQALAKVGDMSHVLRHIEI